MNVSDLFLSDQAFNTYMVQNLKNVCCFIEANQKESTHKKENVFSESRDLTTKYKQYKWIETTHDDHANNNVIFHTNVDEINDYNLHLLKLHKKVAVLEVVAKYFTILNVRENPQIS